MWADTVCFIVCGLLISIYAFYVPVTEREKYPLILFAFLFSVEKVAFFVVLGFGIEKSF